MHLSRGYLAELEDLALLRGVLRTGVRSVETADRPKPTLQERFGLALPSGPQGARGLVRRRTVASS